MVQWSYHDYNQREHQNQSVLKEPSIERPLPSNLPLIPPSTRSPPVPPINTMLDEYFISFYEKIELQNYPNPERKNHIQENDHVTDKMTSNKMIAATTNAKDFGIYCDSISKEIGKH